MSTLGPFLSRISDKAHEVADKQRAEFEKGKQDQIGMWKKVLESQDSSPEQRKRAADELSKLYNLKGKGDSPFHKLVNFMQHVGHGKQDAAASPKQLPGLNDPASAAASSGSPAASGAAPAASSGSNGSNIGPAKPGEAVKPKVQAALNKMGKGLGAVEGALGSHPPTLPALSGDMYPSADQVRTNRTKDLDAELATRWPYEEKRIRLQEELRELSAGAKSRNAMASKVRIPGNALTNGLPQERGLTDAMGLPIDPNGIYGPAAGESMGIAQREDGSRYVNAVRVGTGSAREGFTEQWVYDPATNSFRKETMRHGTAAPAPPKAFPGLSPSSSGSSSPRTPGAAGAPRTTGTTGATRKFAAGAGSSDNRKTGNTGIPIRVFPALGKAATAITEARNSLVGDTPDEIGGMARDIEVFKDPDSVKRLSEYIKFVNSQLEESGRMATAAGPVAAAEWYVGLPGAVSNLQAQTLGKYSHTLDDGEEDGPEHRFVADYYRLLGTWGGMRAATSGNSSRWNFKNLISEVPTPGTVTSYPEARRRIENMANESNVAGSRNAMVKPVDVKSLFKDKYIYATDPQGKLHRAKPGTPLQPGWKPAQAPSGTPPSQ